MTLLEEIQAKCTQEEIASKDHALIAAKVSEGRTQKNTKEVGTGTIIETIGLAAGNAFLDVINTAPDFRHVKTLVNEGRLIVSSALVGQTIDGFVTASILTSDQGAALKALGVTDAPVSVVQVAQALEGA